MSLFRKISSDIKNHLLSNDRILLINGARQIGKTFIIREVCREMFQNFIEINLLDDYNSHKYFQNVKTIDDFYFQVSLIAGNKLVNKESTIIFLDEIQVYEHLLTLLKFLQQDNRYTYIVSGSLLGVTLKKTTSIPMGSITIKQMYQLDFEEFLLANGFNNFAIDTIRNKYKALQQLDKSTHDRLMDLFKKYLIVGGLPAAVKEFVATKNMYEIRKIQDETREFYSMDCSKYDKGNKLKIRRIYEMIPSAMGNKKKRIVIKDIENVSWKKSMHYIDEFDYLINSGIVNEVKAISNPKFPLIETSSKNLLKLYFNDVGILSNVLYKNNVNAVLSDLRSINLGSLYETVVANELKAHGHKLFYYDNRNNGEVDYLIDNYDSLQVLPIEVKSGKDYKIHSALNKLVSNAEYNIDRAIVLSNERTINQNDKIIYLPIYYVMFL